MAAQGHGRGLQRLFAQPTVHLLADRFERERHGSHIRDSCMLRALLAGYVMLGSLLVELRHVVLILDDEVRRSDSPRLLVEVIRRCTLHLVSNDKLPVEASLGTAPALLLQLLRVKRGQVDVDFFGGGEENVRSLVALQELITDLKLG